MAGTGLPDSSPAMERPLDLASAYQDANKVGYTFCSYVNVKMESIKDTIARILDETTSKGLALEVGSGYGYHVAYYAPLFADLIWQPTDVDDNTFDVIVNHCDGLPNVLNPAHLDVTAEGWGKQFAASGGASLVLAINLLHLGDSAIVEGLARGANQVLIKGGILVVYGPFKRGQELSSDHDRELENTLKGHSDEWCIKDVETVQEEFERNGFQKVEITEHINSNFILVFKKP